ncbi:hypothetical protein [Vibrio sonorensis]|uniref:hypothetical protein n=1 Tax=Vibrio sonorensis TaxID=1004316 RepID=UPI0008DA87F3|nr:hypothetical protein [Vibrio sonorensis]
MKLFIKENGGVMLIITTIVAAAWWIQSSITAVQIQQSDRFNEQQKQFTEMLEKIGEVDKSALERDHKLDIRLSTVELKLYANR